MSDPSVWYLYHDATGHWLTDDGDYSESVVDAKVFFSEEDAQVANDASGEGDDHMVLGWF